MSNEHTATSPAYMPPPPSPSFYERHRIFIKGALIAALILLMLVPASMISNLVAERQDRQAEVIKEVNSKWAGAQTVTGPVLLVPYYSGMPQGVEGGQRHWLYLLPDVLRVNGDVVPESRHRSRYDVTLYRSDLQLSGSFSAQSLDRLDIDPAAIRWNEARLVLGIDDTHGLQDEVMLSWADRQLHLEAGVPDNQVVREGLSVAAGLNQGGTAFAVRLKLRGSGQLHFIPVGRHTEVSLRSSWPHPGFEGKYMPDVPAGDTKHGFHASWKILQASRPYPQAWKDGAQDLRTSSFGVRLVQPADSYARTDRSVKYAILFIGLTFIIYFFLELLQKRQVHALQYLLVGFALCIFYTLLLSISEYLGFNSAYLIAALATVSLIGLYTWSVFRSGKTALGFTATLGALYAYIFILIQLEDYALLFGSIGLFVILAVIMFCSRRIDWFHTGRQAVPAA